MEEDLAAILRHQLDKAFKYGRDQRSKLHAIRKQRSALRVRVDELETALVDVVLNSKNYEEAVALAKAALVKEEEEANV